MRWWLLRWWATRLPRTTGRLLELLLKRLLLRWLWWGGLRVGRLLELRLRHPCLLRWRPGHLWWGP